MIYWDYVDVALCVHVCVCVSEYNNHAEFNTAQVT